MNIPALRPVPQPQPSAQQYRHLLLRSGNEEFLGAQVIATFDTEREAIEEGERQLARAPEFHFWHVVAAHEMVRTTIITSRPIDG